MEEKMPKVAESIPRSRSREMDGVVQVKRIGLKCQPYALDRLEFSAHAEIEIRDVRSKQP
jgi:hypothetical protein